MLGTFKLLQNKKFLFLLGHKAQQIYQQFFIFLYDGAFEQKITQNGFSQKLVHFPKRSGSFLFPETQK